jgi:hypothetical protein
MWAFGTAMWEIFSYGLMPYDGVPNAEVQRHVREGLRLAKPVSCPDAVFALMQQVGLIVFLLFYLIVFCVLRFLSAHAYCMSASAERSAKHCTFKVLQRDFCIQRRKCVYSQFFSHSQFRLQTRSKHFQNK